MSLFFVFFFVHLCVFVVKKITTKDTKDTKNAAPITETKLEFCI